VEEIFRLQNAEEYPLPNVCTCPPAVPLGPAVVLAASRGQDSSRSPPIVRKSCCLSPEGHCCAGWSTSFKKENIHDITVVGGYCADAIDTTGIRLVVNERYARTGELASLACALDALESETVISYGDFCIAVTLLPIWSIASRFAVIVDSSPTGVSNHTVRDFACCSRNDDRGLFGTPVLLQRITSAPPAKREAFEAAAEQDPLQGRWIGLLKVSDRD